MFPGPQVPPTRGMGPRGPSFPPNMPPQGHGKLILILSQENYFNTFYAS